MSNKTWQRVTSPYRITQCYLPPDRGDIPAFTPAEAGTRLSDPRGMQGWVDVVWLVTYHMHAFAWSLLFAMGLQLQVPLKSGALSRGDSGFWANTSQPDKRHLDRFIGFCRAQHCARRVDYGACDMCRNRPHLRIASGLCGRIDADSNTICNKTVLTCTPDL